MQKLTADKNKIVSAISKSVFVNSTSGWENYDGDASNSLTTAMLFTAVETDLKWNSGFNDKQDNLVRKIMIPMVWRDHTRKLETPGNRKPPNADGTDTCVNSLIPEIEQVNKVLWDHQFTVITSIINTAQLGKIQDQIYRELFASLFVPYYSAPIPREGEVFKNAKEFDYEAYAKSLYDIISREVMSCDWEDPVGYNTLGL